jgi:hypothetical protein
MAHLHASHHWPQRHEFQAQPTCQPAPSRDGRLAHLTREDLDRRIAQAQHDRTAAEKRIAALQALQTAMSNHNAATYGELPQPVRDRYRHALIDHWDL